MKSLSLFPGINKKKASAIFSLGMPNFFYTKDGEKIQLQIKEEGSYYELRDEDGIWTPDKNDLIVSLDIKYKNGCRLYGYDPYDIENLSCACSDAIIGIALAWYSQDSRQRKTIPIGDINNSDEECGISFSYKFDKAVLRGIVSFSIILYLKKEGIPSEDEMLFANKQGFILGEIENFNVVLDGNGSYFTISEINKPGAPLWNVEYDIDDPSTDIFSDCVSINLNSAHESYKYIDKKSDDFILQLFLEIVSNSMATVIETVRSQDESFDCLNNPEEGSVAQALLYFKDVLDWDFTSPISLSNSIRSFFDNKGSSL